MNRQSGRPSGTGGAVSARVSSRSSGSQPVGMPHFFRVAVAAAALGVAGCVDLPDSTAGDGSTGDAASGTMDGGQVGGDAAGQDGAGGDGGSAGGPGGSGGDGGAAGGPGGSGGEGAAGGIGGSGGDGGSAGGMGGSGGDGGFAGGEGGSGGDGGSAGGIGGSGGDGGFAGGEGGGGGDGGAAGGIGGSGGDGAAGGIGGEGGMGAAGGIGGEGGMGAAGGIGGEGGMGAAGGIGGSGGDGAAGGDGGIGGEGGEGGAVLPPECVAGATEARPCGPTLSDVMTRTCDASGHWPDFGPCVEQRDCDGDEVDVRACGADGLGIESRVCSNGRWMNQSTCVSPVSCVDPATGACGLPAGEVCNGLDDDADGIADEGLLDAAAVRPATTFDLAVSQSIERGIEWIRRREAQGNYLRGDAEDNAALAAVVLMSRRERDGLGAPVGYAGLSAADQALVQRLIRIALRDQFFALNGRNDDGYAERLAAIIMALTLYVPTGDPGLPDDNLAGLTADQVRRNAVAQLMRQQGNRAPDNLGGWSVISANSAADLNLTQLAACGLAAVAPEMPEVEAALAAVQPLLGVHQLVDGGYRSLAPQFSETAATAGGLWLAARSGLPPAQRRRAAAFTWLATHHAPDAVVDPIIYRGTYLAKWSIYNALAAAGGADDLRFATRDPRLTRWPDARPGVYFDLALSLLTWQLADGRIGGGENGSAAGRSLDNDHLMALLFLERHTCEPGLPLPDVAAAPHCADGIDNDHDGQIDADDPQCRFACTLRESAVPACSNRVDDDGDGRIDHLEDPGCDGPGGTVEDPECDNGVDDDGDGAVDFEWPGGAESDPHCASAADRCEAVDTTWCGEACVYLATDAAHCGLCGRACNPGVACEAGVCMEGPGLLAGVRQQATAPEATGWRECHRGPFIVQLPLDDLRSDCAGQYIAMGCRRVGSATWDLLAMGEADQVWLDTQPPEGSPPHLHNGAVWFFGRDGAMGFGTPGTTLRQGRCGGEVTDAERRMCWNTQRGNLIDGYRCGLRYTAQQTAQYERAVWTFP